MGFIFSKFSKLGSGAKHPLNQTPPPQLLRQTNFSNPSTPFGLATAPPASPAPNPPASPVCESDLILLNV